MWPVLAQEQTTHDWSNVIDELARTPLSHVLGFVAICTVIRLIAAPFLAKVPAHQRGLGFSLLRLLNEALDAVIYAGVFVFLLIRPFCIQAFKIPSDSMVPTLLTGDFIVANKAIYRYSDPKFGDIIVFRPPFWACTPDQLDADGQVNVDFIKRCRGVPGDTVEVRNGTLYRNGVAVNEPFISARMDHDFKLVYEAQGMNDPHADSVQSHYWPLSIQGDEVNDDPRMTAKPYVLNDPKQEDAMRNLPPAKIPPGYYLMMGDNRNESFDGRSWGLVSKSDIIGRSEFIWLPVSRWRITR